MIRLLPVSNPVVVIRIERFRAGEKELLPADGTWNANVEFGVPFTLLYSG
ncbi:hypothetical protein [Flavisolibacter nicotianae]|nr:hypothetical protein [Flavisolibacter nicotianae]